MDIVRGSKMFYLTRRNTYMKWPTPKRPESGLIRPIVTRMYGTINCSLPFRLSLRPIEKSLHTREHESHCVIVIAQLFVSNGALSQILLYWSISDLPIQIHFNWRIFNDPSRFEPIQLVHDQGHWV